MLSAVADAEHGGLLASRSSRAQRASDYERYLNTDELLALQKTADEWVHRDELLFQTVHQSSELWLKLAWNEVEAAAAHLGDGEIARGAPAAAPRASLPAATRRRSSTCSSRCRPGSTRRSARCSGTAAASTRRASASSAA